MSDVRPYISSGYEVSTWNMSSIYNGVDPIVPGVSNFVVPAINDYIDKIVNNTIIKYRVTNVKDLIATYERVYSDAETDSVVDLTTTDLSATTVVLIRNSISPILAAIHIGLPIETNIDVAYGKLFVGYDIDNVSSVVSRTLDNDGVVINDRIKVTKDAINNNVYRASQFHIDRIIDDKSMGTLVFYGYDDMPIFKYTIVYREVDHLINFSDTELFITELVLETPLLNPAKSKEILVEKGFLNASFNPRVFKVFNTGQREEISLTSRFLKLEGWGNYIYGEENDVFPLSVQYTLADNEKSDLVSDELGETITEAYTVRVTDTAGSVNYKIYPTVTWDNDAAIYNVKYYLYDSTYKTTVDVTTKIELSNQFSGYNFADKQLFNYSLDLNDIGISTGDEYCSGSFAIRLFAKPMDATTPFSVYMVPNDEIRYYGESLRTRITLNGSATILSIDSDYTQYEEWLDNVYYKLLPAYESDTHDKAPEPTHVDVYVGDDLITLDILNQWNLGGRWVNDVPDYPTTVELVWYSYGADGSRNYLARSTMQLEVV